MNDSNSRLEHRLEEIASGVSGTLGCYVMAVDGRVLYSRNSEVTFPQASAIKVPVLLEVLGQREEGRLDWNCTVRIEKTNQVSGTGILSAFSDGGSQICISDLCTLMIVASDNTATNLLIELVGMDSVTGRMRSLGLPNTKLRRVMMDTEASARGDENVSTPAEAAHLMKMLARGEFFSRDVSEEALSFLRKPKSTAIRKAIPEGIPVAGKPGAIPGVATEWALVEWKDLPYIITLMGKDGREAEFLPAFSEIAAVIHEHLEETK